MITSRQIQNLSVSDFSFLYSQCIININVEHIFGKILEEQIMNNKRVLLYDLSEISELYYSPVIEELEKRVSVSSIYVRKNILYIDWSLDKA